MTSLPGYDQWLESPYVQAAQYQEDFERWCDENGYDADDYDAAADYQRELDEGGDDDYEEPEPEEYDAWRARFLGRPR